MQETDIQQPSCRISLRAMEPEDLDMLYGIENDSDLWNIGPTNVPYSRYLLHDYIANASNDIYVDRQVRLIVQFDETPIGIVDVTDFSPAHCRAEVGIIIRADYRGRGFATMALRQISNYSKTTLHLHQLYAVVDMRNETSMRLFTRCGYTQKCVLRDWLYDGEAYHDAAVLQLFL